MEHGASEAGWGWVVPIFIAVSALCGAALLRAALRVFAGYGKPAEPGEFGPADEEAGEEPPRRTPRSLLAPMALLLLASLAVGVWPDLAHSTVAAAERLTGPATAPEAPIPAWYDWLYAALSVAAAVVLAPALARTPAAGELLLGLVRRPLSVLRALHSGRPGDYVAFATMGTAIVACLCALTLG